MLIGHTHRYSMFTLYLLCGWNTVWLKWLFTTRLWLPYKLYHTVCHLVVFNSHIWLYLLCKHWSRLLQIYTLPVILWDKNWHAFTCPTLFTNQKMILGALCAREMSVITRLGGMDGFSQINGAFLGYGILVLGGIGKDTYVRRYIGDMSTYVHIYRYMSSRVYFTLYLVWLHGFVCRSRVSARLVHFWTQRVLYIHSKYSAAGNYSWNIDIVSRENIFFTPPDQLFLTPVDIVPKWRCYPQSGNICIYRT